MEVQGITATTLLTLALGIGATTAIFSTVYSLILKPPSFQDPEQIVELYSSAPKAGLYHMPANVPFYLDYFKEMPVAGLEKYSHRFLSCRCDGRCVAAEPCALCFAHDLAVRDFDLREIASEARRRRVGIRSTGLLSSARSVPMWRPSSPIIVKIDGFRALPRDEGWCGGGIGTSRALCDASGRTFLLSDRPFSGRNQPRPRHVTPVNDLRAGPFLACPTGTRRIESPAEGEGHVRDLALDCWNLDGRVILSRWRLGDPLLWALGAVAYETLRTAKGARDPGFVTGGLTADGVLRFGLSARSARDLLLAVTHLRLHKLAANQQA